MQILHFLPVYAPAWQYGGPILSVSRLCEGLVLQGVDVRVITTNAGLPDFPADQLGLSQYINGVEVIYYPVDNEKGIIRSSALVKALPDHMAWADLLHISSIWQPLGLSVQQAAHAAGVPVIQTLRGALGPYSWRRGWWKKLPYFWLKERPFLQQAAALHCTTSQEASEISSLGLKPPTIVLPNPLDLTKHKYDPNDGQRWRREKGISSETKLFLVAGRLHHKKGLDLLPKALHPLRHKPWKIIFIGKDTDGTGSWLKREMDRYGLSERCLWLNSLPPEQLSGPYNAADWLLLPSHHENFGNVVAEALACGCGAIISEKVGISNMLSTRSGVIIRKRSVSLWSEALSEALISNRPGNRSEDYVSKEFCLKTLSTKMIAHYKQLLSQD